MANQPVSVGNLKTTVVQLRRCNNYDCRVQTFRGAPFPGFQNCPVCTHMGVIIPEE